MLTFGLLFFLDLRPKLDQVDVPTFKDNGAEISFFDWDRWEERFDRDTTIATGIKNTKRDSFEYIACSVTVSGTFEQNFAFGAGLASGSGGGMFFTFCAVNIRYETKNVDSFVNNSAAVGGAIACLYSRIFMENAIFTYNRAYRWAGAIWFQGYERRNRLCPFFCESKACEFKKNVASDLGGAIVLTCAADSYFENVNFIENQCGITGGAFYLVESPAKFFNSDFLKNQAGDTNIRKLTANNFNINSKLAVRFRGRGGGAMAFISYTDYKEAGEGRMLYTQGCCFLLNKATYGYSFRADGTGAGHVILFEGFCLWHSFHDWMSGIEENNIAYANRYVENGTLEKNVYYASEETCTDVVSPEYEPVTSRATKFKFAKPSNKAGKSSGPTFMPSPTDFPDKATPITQLPLRTTRSAKVFPTTQVFPTFKRLTVHRTPTPTPLPSTPRSTPEATGLTPYPTPVPSPSPTLADTPMDTPLETPYMTPAKSPTRSPKPTPANTPETPSATRTPQPSPLQTVIPRSPARSPRKTPKQTIPPATTPPNTPRRTPKKTKKVLPTPSQSPRKGYYYSETETKVETVLVTLTTTDKATFTNALVKFHSKSTYSNSLTTIVEQMQTTIKTLTKTSTSTLVKAELGFNPDEEGSDLAIIIAAIFSGLLLVLVVSAFIWFFIGYTRSSSSSDSAVQMDEVHLLETPAPSAQTMADENPLWSTSVMGDNDDPFRNDFEEVHADGFFNERAETADSDN